MATVVAIAITREQAIARLKAATSQIAELLKVEIVDFPEHNRDPNYLQAQQLRAMADFLERVVAVLTPELEGLDGMTNAELKALATERGIDVTGLRKKDDFIKAIKAASNAAPQPEDEEAVETLPPETPEE